MFKIPSYKNETSILKYHEVTSPPPPHPSMILMPQTQISELTASLVHLHYADLRMLVMQTAAFLFCLLKKPFIFYNCSYNKSRV